ncbi:MAG: VF530 family protein [Gallionella sp.]|jgi:uncharacterized protein (DUF2132 family)
MDTIKKPASRPILEGLTLETIVTQLSESMGWEAMGDAVPIRCFTHDPSIKSSLKFLRRTPWARAKVEALYLQRAQAAAREK